MPSKQFYGVEDFIKDHIRYGQHWNKKVIDLTSAKWQELECDTWLDGINFAKGSKFKVFETTNFGWINFASDTKTSDGNIPNRRIFKW